MQKREKMEWRRVSEVIEPVRVESLSIASRRSCAIKSVESPSVRPSLTLVNVSAASVSA